MIRSGPHSHACMYSNSVLRVHCALILKDQKCRIILEVKTNKDKPTLSRLTKHLLLVAEEEGQIVPAGQISLTTLMQNLFHGRKINPKLCQLSHARQRARPREYRTLISQTPLLGLSDPLNKLFVPLLKTSWGHLSLPYGISSGSQIFF